MSYVWLLVDFIPIFQSTLVLIKYWRSKKRDNLYLSLLYQKSIWLNEKFINYLTTQFVQHIMSKFAALHRQWWRLQMSENLEWDEKLQKKPNKLSLRRCPSDGTLNGALWQG